MKYAIVLLTTLVYATAANAATIVADVAGTVGLPGFKTVTLSVQTEGGESFRGFDATFTGPLNQFSFVGLHFVFDNYGAVDCFSCEFEPRLVDSYFLFNSHDVLSIGPDENDNLLTAAVTNLIRQNPPLPNPGPFVQLVIPAGSSPLGSEHQVVLDLDIGLPEPFSYTGPLSGLIVPEPGTLGLMSFVMVGFVGLRRRS